MSRTAAAYLNIPLQQIEKVDQVRRVFEHNVSAAIDAALRHTDATPEIDTLCDLLRMAAAEVVRTTDKNDQDAAKQDFVAVANELRQALLARGNRGKRREIDALGTV